MPNSEELQQAIYHMKLELLQIFIQGEVNVADDKLKTEFLLSNETIKLGFALLAVLTHEGNIIIRPIGGDWGYDIIEAIQEMAEKYPNCKMRLYEHLYDDWRRYFEGVVPWEQLL